MWSHGPLNHTKSDIIVVTKCYIRCTKFLNKHESCETSVTGTAVLDVRCFTLSGSLLEHRKAAVALQPHKNSQPHISQPQLHIMH